MSEDWFTWDENTWEGHEFGEEIALPFIFPPQTILIPAYMDVEVIVKTPKKLDVSSFQPNGRVGNPEVVFNEENLQSCKLNPDLNLYMFRKRNSVLLSSILPLNEILKIPKIIRETYIEEIPNEMHSLARKVYEGNNTTEAIEAFYSFVQSHSILEKNPTTGKNLDVLIKECRESGYFHSTCKEDRDFLAGLCYAKGLPVRKILGKYPYKRGGHVWGEVCVPTSNGYEWLPVDAAKGYFNKLSYEHFFLSHIKEQKGNFVRRVADCFLENPKEFVLKINYFG